jgi:CheY-like chemotaxis protein
MAVVLICSTRSLDRELQGTVLFRSGVEREFVRSAAEVQSKLNTNRAVLLCIHRQVSGVENLIRTLRKSPTLKRISIVVFSEDDFDPSEVEVLEAGANAILRLPPGDDFNGRVSRLMQVPTRRDVRIPVRLQVAASSGFGATVPVLALNLSATGVLLESNHPLNMGDEVNVAFRFEETGEIFSATAHITRTAGPSRYGATFETISRGEQALRTFLAGTSAA